MELGGLEPPTSWVRLSRAGHVPIAGTGRFPAASKERSPVPPRRHGSDRVRFSRIWPPSAQYVALGCGTYGIRRGPLFGEAEEVGDLLGWALARRPVAGPSGRSSQCSIAGVWPDLSFEGASPSPGGPVRWMASQLERLAALDLFAPVRVRRQPRLLLDRRTLRKRLRGRTVLERQRPRWTSLGCRQRHGGGDSKQPRPRRASRLERPQTARATTTPEAPRRRPESSPAFGSSGHAALAAAAPPDR